MAYKTKAEKRAYKDGLFAGLFGKNRKRKRRKKAPSRKYNSSRSKKSTKKTTGKRTQSSRNGGIDFNSRLWRVSLADANRNLWDTCTEAEIREAAKDVYRSAKKDGRYAEYLYDEYGGF